MNIREFIVSADPSLTECHLRVSVHSEVEHRHRPRHHQPQSLLMKHDTHTQQTHGVLWGIRVWRNQSGPYVSHTAGGSKRLSPARPDRRWSIAPAWHFFLPEPWGGPTRPDIPATHMHLSILPFINTPFEFVLWLSDIAKILIYRLIIFDHF